MAMEKQNVSKKTLPSDDLSSNSSSSSTTNTDAGAGAGALQVFEKLILTAVQTEPAKGVNFTINYNVSHVKNMHNQVNTLDESLNNKIEELSRKLKSLEKDLRSTQEHTSAALDLIISEGTIIDKFVKQNNISKNVIMAEIISNHKFDARS